MSVKILADNKATKKITDISGSSNIYNKQITVKIKASEPDTVIIDKAMSIKLYDKSPRIQIKQKLPFRVRFTNIQIPGAMSVPPIGIAVIGFNNYIL